MLPLLSSEFLTPYLYMFLGLVAKKIVFAVIFTRLRAPYTLKGPIHPKLNCAV
jgi:tellurite resistance protein TehA-like permease